VPDTDSKADSKAGSSGQPGQAKDRVAGREEEAVESQLQEPPVHGNKQAIEEAVSTHPARPQPLADVTTNTEAVARMKEETFAEGARMQKALDHAASHRERAEPKVSVKLKFTSCINRTNRNLHIHRHKCGVQGTGHKRLATTTAATNTHTQQQQQHTHSR
jgi:hypothetical protein